MTGFREWLEGIGRVHADYDPVVVGNLIEGYRKANGADDRTVLDRLSADAPGEQAFAMTLYYSRWSDEAASQQPPAWMTEWKTDSLDRTVRRVYIATNRFVIYSTKDEELEDLCGLHYELAGSYGHCQLLRGRLGGLKPDIACITDAVCSIRPMFRSEGSDAVRDYNLFRERICELVAQAMSSAFENRPEQARSIVVEARGIVEERRDSLNRMRYITANALSAAAILALGWVLIATGYGGSLFPDMAIGQGVTMSVAPVLMAGALGAFFSVSLSLRNLKVSRSITLFEMFYAGFVRVPIGVIGAIAVVWLIEGGWILGAVAPEFKRASILLFGFIAGFSEMFVPNALNQVQDRTRAEAPGGAAKTGAAAG